MDEEPSSSATDPDDSIPDMFVHLEGAKERHQEQAARSASKSQSSGTPLQRAIRERTDCAVLVSNHEQRLQEMVDNDAITHRSGKRWASAEVGVDAHDHMPIYYRLDGLVTHVGYISQIILDPDENEAAAKEFLEHISSTDDYGDYNDELDTTTFIVTGGRRLTDPFSQSELRKLSGAGHINENFSRQPAYVIQRPGDFPGFS